MRPGLTIDGSDGGTQRITLPPHRIDAYDYSGDQQHHGHQCPQHHLHQRAYHASSWHRRRLYIRIGLQCRTWLHIYILNNQARHCVLSPRSDARAIFIAKVNKNPKSSKSTDALFAESGKISQQKPKCTLSAKKHLGENRKSRNFATDMRNRWRDMVARECCVSANILIFRKLKWI